MWNHLLTADQANQVLALAERAREVDQIDPLNEEARLSLTGPRARHLLASGEDGLLGYLNWSPELMTAQLVVDPTQRRRGVGTFLWHEMRATGPAGLWSFGDLAPARAFAQHLNLVSVRQLLQLSCPLHDLSPIGSTAGLKLRSYQPRDAAALLDVNAAAFAHHPEQGRLDADGLAARMAEPWFDAGDLIVAFDTVGMVGFHWTKVVDHTGEVYVIGVHPRAQGRGFGKALLDAGMSHLAAKGLPMVSLFVDASEQIAVRMYERAGFKRVRQDVYYAPRNEEQAWPSPTDRSISTT